MLRHGHVDGKALGLEINEEDDEYIIDSESDEEGTAVAIRRSILGYDDSGMGTDQEIAFGFTPEQSVFAPRVDVCDSGAYYDTSILRDMLQADWDRVVEEQPKVRLFFLKKHDGASCVGDADKEKTLLGRVAGDFCKAGSPYIQYF